MSKPDGYKLDKKIVDSTGKPPKINSLEQFLVWKFLKNVPTTSLDWSREIKIARIFLEAYPSVDFWNFVDLGFKLNSLLWFTTDKGVAFLKQEKRRKEFIENSKMFQEKVSPQILDEQTPPDDDYVPPPAPKPKTLMDFIKKK